MNVAIIGLGLIGGSIALELKKNGFSKKRLELTKIYRIVRKQLL